MNQQQQRAASAGGREAKEYWYPCLPNWMQNCVCKPGDKTDCGIPLSRNPKDGKP